MTPADETQPPDRRTFGWLRDIYGNRFWKPFTDKLLLEITEQFDADEHSNLEGLYDGWAEQLENLGVTSGQFAALLLDSYGAYWLKQGKQTDGEHAQEQYVRLKSQIYHLRGQRLPEVVGGALATIVRRSLNDDMGYVPRFEALLTDEDTLLSEVARLGDWYLKNPE